MTERANNRFYIPLPGSQETKIPVEQFTSYGKNCSPDQFEPDQRAAVGRILGRVAKSVEKQGYKLSDSHKISVDLSDENLILKAETNGETKEFAISYGDLSPTRAKTQEAAAPKQMTDHQVSYPVKQNPSLLQRISNLFQAIKYKLFGKEESEDKIPLLNDQPSLSAQSEAEASDKGRRITQDYIHGGQKVDTEIIERCNVLETYSKILKQEGSKDLDQLNQYTEGRKNKDKQTKWVKSSDFRQHCRDSSYEKACKTFPLGAPVNMRLHKMEGPDGKNAEQILRMGVITDVSNGWYSLKDLEEMQKNPALKKEKIKEIDEFIAHPSKLGILGKIIQKFKPDYGSLKGDRLASAERAKKLLENVDKTLDDRKKVLQRQMLQVVTEQLNANLDKIEEGQEFDLFQVSLLNLKKKQLDSTGWMHDEGVAYEDMRRIMHEFQGMTVRLGDVEAPRLDKKSIFIPSEKNAEITLNTFVFNISPQGNLKNDGVQLYDNSVELDRLKAKHPDFFDKHDDLRKRLVGDDSGYDLAEDLSACIADHLKNDTNGSLGINCMSGKDRTGFIAARLMIRNLSSSEKFAKKILNKDYPATKVVEDNTPGVRVLKIHPVTILEKGLPGFTNLESIGYIFRQFVEMGTQKLPT